MDRSRRLGWAIVALGAAAALLIRVAGPGFAPPLYDGVIVIPPYVWLDPPPDQPGGAVGTSAKVAVTNGQNRIVAVATDEDTPQAQILATPGVLLLAQGATSLSVSITPVEPVQPVPSGYIDGNVYRFLVVDQLGRPATAPASAFVSIILRAADPADVDGTLEQFDGTSWKTLVTSSEGGAGFLAVVTSFGDFAVVHGGTSPFATPTPAVTEPPSTPPSTPEATALASTVPTTEPTTPPEPAPDGLSLPVLAGAGAVIAVVVIGATLLLARRREREDW